MTLVRQSNWTALLFEYFRARTSMPFVWGSNDCVMFAAGAVKEMTGEDFTSEYPKYSTARHALRIMKAHGGLESMVGRVLPETPVLMAQRGDVALTTGEDGIPALCIVMGHVAWGPGEKGLESLPLELMTKAWKV